MRQYRNLLQRCVSSALHTSTALLAASGAARRSSGSRPSALHHDDEIEVDGEFFHPTEAATTRRRSRQPRQTTRTPAQLLADLGGGDAPVVDPVELLLQKHDVRAGHSRHGGGGAGGGHGGRVGGEDGEEGEGGSSSSFAGGGRGGGSGGKSGSVGKAKGKKALLTPPTKAESAAAAAAAVSASARGRGKNSSTRSIEDTSASLDADVEDGETDDGVVGVVVADRSASTGSAATSSTDADGAQKSLQILTNPFRGLHNEVARSYRIDQLLETATPADMLLARQERKSTAFSFMKFKAGEAFYQGHWASLPEMQQQLDSTVQAAAPRRSAAGPYVRGTPIPGLTLFNNDLGLQSPLVQCSYPLILAQRMLLFPDHLRQFHAICGREDVPCDFYADIDLPGETQVGAEKALLEVLNYLEVRLPGIGFTDPFFLVLTNAVPGTDKMSYHVHARSMTYVQERQQRAELELKMGSSSGSGSSKRKSASKKKGKGKNKKSAVEEPELALGEAEGDEGADDVDEANDEYDDLSDMVNVVDNTTTTGKKKGSAASTKMIAFQDYRTVKLIGDEVNQTLGRDLIDTHCYRPNGMLRCAFSSKLPSTQDHDYHAQQQQSGSTAASIAAALRKRLVPLVTARDSALQKRLSDMEAVLRTMTDPEILELTFCTRHMDHDPKLQKLVHEHAKSLVILDSHAPAGSAAQQRSAQVLQATHKHRWKLIRPSHILGPQAAQAVEYDAYGNVVSPFLTEGAKWRRYKAVTAKLRKLPPRAAESYDVWVRVGLALHNFSNEDNCFEEWVLFSLKSPQKYSREVCRKKWVQFERNPDALNWRRGYNYLNSTVWRQV